MSKNDTHEIFQKTDEVIQNIITTITDVFDGSMSETFKMCLVDERETLKERRTQFLEKAQTLKVPHLELSISTTSSQSGIKKTATSPFSSDQQIADYLFDVCNETVKKIYTYLNHYKAIDEKTKKDIKENVKAVERLREHLANYL